MEEYIRTLTEQIRCKKARDMVGDEIRNHILDQTESYKEQGMGEEKAISKAVQDMGDPVEAGIALDRVHRPQIAWGMIVLMAVIAVLSMLIHVSIGMNYAELGEGYIRRQIAGTAAGFLAMLVVCRLDYSVIAKHAKKIALLFLALFIYTIFFQTMEINGARRYIQLAGQLVSLRPFVYLYIPVYGALLYQYHGTGYRGIFKSILWMLIPSLTGILLSSLSIVLLLIAMMLVLLIMAVAMDWFQIKHKKVFLAVFSFGSLSFSFLILGLFYLTGNLSDYQVERIRGFISRESVGSNYISSMLIKYWEDSCFVGDSGAEFAGILPDFYEDYIVTFLASQYGIMFAVLTGILILLLVAGIFYASLRQKNQLGKIMGCGCGMVFLLLSVINYMENVGLLLVTSTHLPFFSAGATDMIISYILMGIVLSIYRYKSILPGGFCGTVEKLKLKVSLSFEK